MQRLFLLFLSIMLGVLIFVCSQGDFEMPLIAKTSGKVELKSFEPFYYAALKIPSSVNELTAHIAQFQNELRKQNLNKSKLVFLIKPLQNSEHNEWIIARQISDTVSVKKPLFKEKWNWQTVLVWSEKERSNTGFHTEEIISYLNEHKLFTAGPLVEIFEKFSVKPTYWLPVDREVGN